jgi:hypothetical protein
MIISFEVKINIGGEHDILNVKKSIRKNFPPSDPGVDEGVEIEHFDVKGEYYRIHFDVESELDPKKGITPMIKKVKKIYLRKEKIKKIFNDN